MRSIVDYFERIQNQIKGLSKAEIERYEEQILSEERGNLRIRVRFSDNSLLEISEAIILKKGRIEWLSYRYHYQSSDGKVIFRYDNTPHHPEVATHPEHKHVREEVVDAKHPEIEKVLKEIEEHLKLISKQ